MTAQRTTLASLRRPLPLQTTQGTLALDLTPRLEPPRLAPPSATADGSGAPAPGGDVVGIDIVARRQLEGWARRYAQAVVEIVNGDRPASQLVRWTSPRVHEELARRAQIVARAGVHQAGQGRGRRPVVRPAVVNVRSCFISPAVAEVSVHVRYGQRSRAVAARFEHRDQKWICTALEFA
ncbi:conserved hypothetical protein [metagenome]|uniref:Uncharacterized protein n=1 Tax=metagenome TaxID=256318 RepID=A0A2P2CGD4_9ZZZZ